MKKVFSIFAITSVILSFSTTILAGSSSGVQIEQVASADSGVTILWATGGWGAAATNSCSTGTGVVAFDSRTEAGKSLLAIALSAYMAEKYVIAHTDDNTCLPVGGLAPVVIRIDIFG